MTMVCSRVNCGERATALLLYDPRGAEAWLRDRDPIGDRSQGIILCGGHADRATVPLGWTLTDERSPVYSGISAPLVDISDHSADIRPDVVSDAVGATIDVTDHADVGAPADAVEPVEDVEELPSAADVADFAADAAGDPATEDSGPDADVLTLWADQPADSEEAEEAHDGSGPQSPLLARAFRAAHRQ
jgi:hypothetical protein